MNEDKDIIANGILFVSYNFPDAIKFTLTLVDINKITKYVLDGKFDTIMYFYDYNLLRGLLTYFISIEEYEICDKIVNAINEHNEFHKDKLENTPL